MGYGLFWDQGSKTDPKRLFFRRPPMRANQGPDGKDAMRLAPNTFNLRVRREPNEW